MTMQIFEFDDDVLSPEEVRFRILRSVSLSKYLPELRLRQNNLLHCLWYETGSPCRVSPSMSRRPANYGNCLTNSSTLPQQGSS